MNNIEKQVKELEDKLLADVKKQIDDFKSNLIKEENKYELGKPITEIEDLKHTFRIDEMYLDVMKNYHDSNVDQFLKLGILYHSRESAQFALDKMLIEQALRVYLKSLKEEEVYKQWYFEENSRKRIGYLDYVHVTLNNFKIPSSQLENFKSTDYTLERTGITKTFPEWILEYKIL